MLPDRLRDYLASKGLVGTDVPKIVAAWEVCKYSTKGVLVLVGIRYQPMSRLFQRAYRPLRERARERWTWQLEWIRGSETRAARQFRALQARRARLRDSYQDWREKHQAWRETLRRWRLELRRTVPPRAPQGWYERLAAWYRTQAAKRSEVVAQSRWLAAVARWLALEPRQLAVGTAEGLILGVVLAPVYYPLYFYFIVRYYQRQHFEDVDHYRDLSALSRLGPWRD
uniref:Uncharacterized protein n=1 Tax=Zooxanthella nutricula TaxID=1333877 RepID=A0A7S2JE73_9DINO